VVCEVQFLNGSKVITLRSNVVLRNETEFALELFVAGPQQTPMSTRAVRQVLLECGDSYCVPMSIAARSRIAVRCYTTSSQGAVVEQVDARFVALSDGVSLPWLPLDAHRLPTRTVILPSDGELFFACVCNPPRLGVLETPSPSAIQLALAPQSLDAPLPHRRGDEADHVVVLRPPLVVVNVLACDAQFMLERVERASPTLPSVARRCVLDRTLKCSESVHVYAVDTSRHLVELKLRLAGYRWSTATTIDPLISSTSPATNAAPAGDDGSGATTELDRMDGSSTTTPVVSAVTSSASGQQDSQWDSMPVLRLTESNRPPLALRVDAQRLYDVRSPTDWSVTPLNVAVFAPYWLVNRTSSALRYANEQDVRSLSPSEALERSWPSDPANRVNRASMRRASTSQAVSSSTTTTSSSSTSASTDAEDALELAGHNRATTVMFSYEVGSGASTAATSGEDGGEQCHEFVQLESHMRSCRRESLEPSDQLRVAGHDWRARDSEWRQCARAVARLRARLHGGRRRRCFLPHQGDSVHAALHGAQLDALCGAAATALAQRDGADAAAGRAARAALARRVGAARGRDVSARRHRVVALGGARPRRRCGDVCQAADRHRHRRARLCRRRSDARRASRCRPTCI
jgi:hypothetical protein